MQIISDTEMLYIFDNDPAMFKMDVENIEESVQDGLIPKDSAENDKKCNIIILMNN